jgi:hypothetical protein
MVSDVDPGQARAYAIKGSPVMAGISGTASNLLDTVLRDKELSMITDEWRGYLAEGTTGAVDLIIKCQDVIHSDDQLLDQTKDILSPVFTEIKEEMDILNSALHGSLIAGLGSSVPQYIESLMKTDVLLELWKTRRYAVSIQPWLERKWLSTYTPNIPDLSLAFRMERRGGLNRAQFNEIASEHGWAYYYYDKLYNTFLTSPDPFLAFSMYRRGIIPQGTFNAYLYAHGVSTSDHAIWEAGLYRNPSLMELTRISDFVELSDVYLGASLKGAGYKDSDIPLLTTALKKRPNREEVRALTTQLVWMYQHGRITQDELTVALDQAGCLPTELNLHLERAELMYGQQLIQEAILVIEWRVYKKDPAVLTVSAIKTEIQALGVNEETSNLLAEQYFYHYVYSPP